MAIKKISYFMIGFILFLPGVSFSEKVTLEVIQVYDKRFPMLSSQDLDEIFEGAKKALKVKLGSKVDFDFKNNGEIDKDIFYDQFYYKDAPFYKNNLNFQYPSNGHPNFNKNKADFINFLKLWKIEDLASYYLDRRILSYEDAYHATIETYMKKMDQLRALGIKDGSKLLIPEARYQSQFHWTSLMYSQNKWDIVITNSFILHDVYNMIDPFSIGELNHPMRAYLYLSPRLALDGRAIQLNTFSIFSEVEGLIENNSFGTRAKTNAALGGAVLARYIATLFYYIPMNEDHGENCLLIWRKERTTLQQDYAALLSGTTVCVQCIPYVQSKEKELEGLAFGLKKDYSMGTQSFLEAYRLLPKRLAETIAPVDIKLLREAYYSAEKAKNRKDLEYVKGALKSAERRFNMIDYCNSLETWSIEENMGTVTNMVLKEGKNDKAVGIEYDLTHRNWATIYYKKGIHLEKLGGFRFFILWEGAQNDIEFKLTDETNSYFVKKIPMSGETSRWQEVTFPIEEFSYAGGSNKKINKNKVHLLSVSVLERSGNKGTLLLDEIEALPRVSP